MVKERVRLHTMEYLIVSITECHEDELDSRSVRLETKPKLPFFTIKQLYARLHPHAVKAATGILLYDNGEASGGIITVENHNHKPLEDWKEGDTLVDCFPE